MRQSTKRHRAPSDIEHHGMSPCVCMCVCVCYSLLPFGGHGGANEKKSPLLRFIHRRGVFSRKQQSPPWDTPETIMVSAQCHRDMKRTRLPACSTGWYWMVLDGTGWRETLHLSHELQAPIEGRLVDAFERQARDRRVKVQSRKYRLDVDVDHRRGREGDLRPFALGAQPHQCTLARLNRDSNSLIQLLRDGVWLHDLETAYCVG